MIKENFFDTLSDKKIVIFLLCYISFLLLFCSHMSPVYFSNEWADVSVYHNIGKAIFNGRTLYTEIFDHKGPLIFFIYGLGYLISGDSFFGMFLIEIASWFAMVCAIYYLSRLYLGKAGSCFVAIVLPIFLIKLMKAGGSAEEFILVFECISLYFFVKYFKDKDALIHKPAIMLLHGVLCSMVLFIKINLIIFWFFPLAGIFINLVLHKEFRNALINLASFLGGVLIIALPICLYLYLNDALQEAYNIYIDLNRKYAQLQGFSETMTLLFYRSFYLYLEPLSQCLMPLIGIFYFSIKFIGNKIGKWVIVLTGMSLYIFVFMSPVYQYYYPIPLLTFSILGVLGVFLFIKRYIKIETFTLKAVLMLSVVFFYAGLSQKDMIESKFASLLVNNPGILMQNSRNIIIQEENPTLLNLSFGLGNSLFTTCNIVPSIRYFLSPNLTYESYPDMRDEQEKYIKNKEVQFIIMSVPVLRKHTSKVTKERKVNNYDYFDSLPALRENYSLVLMDTVINTIDERTFDVYALYKRKDN